MIRTFEDFSKICILPFIYLKEFQTNNEQKNSYTIEILQNAVGLEGISQEIKFLNQKCKLSIHFVYELTIRALVRFIKDDETSYSIKLDFQFDKSSFEN